MLNALRRVLSPFPPVVVQLTATEAVPFAPATVTDNQVRRAGVSANLLPVLPPPPVSLHDPGTAPALVRAECSPVIVPARVEALPLGRFGTLFVEMRERTQRFRNLFRPGVVVPAPPPPPVAAGATLAEEPEPIPSFADFFGPDGSEDEDAVRAPTRPTHQSIPPHPGGVEIGNFLIDELADELARFQGLDSLKRLFWELLAYERVDELAPPACYPPRVASSVISASLFARHQGLYVVCVKVSDGRFLRTVRRALLECAAGQFPHGVALLFCDYAWRRATLGFALAGEGGSGSFLRLAPAAGDARALARRLARLRADTEGGASRSRLDLIRAYRRLIDDHPESGQDRKEFAEQPLDPVQLHIRDIAQYPTMPKAETRALLQRIALISEPERKGTRQAEYEQCRNRLVNGHLRLCHFAIRHYDLRRHRRSMYWTDLMQEGVFGLMSAIGRFDLSHDTEFSTYALYWIRQAIQRAIHNTDRFIRIPVHRFKDGKRLSDGEHRRLARILSLSTNDHNLELEVADHRAIPPVQEAADEELRGRVERGLRALPHREREIIKLRYGIGGGYLSTLEECGRHFKLTRERIRQIETKALGMLARHPALA